MQFWWLTKLIIKRIWPKVALIRVMQNEIQRLSGNLRFKKEKEEEIGGVEGVNSTLQKRKLGIRIVEWRCTAASCIRCYTEKSLWLLV